MVIKISSPQNLLFREILCKMNFTPKMASIFKLAKVLYKIIKLRKNYKAQKFPHCTVKKMSHYFEKQY
jgi:hypothetical protein